MELELASLHTRIHTHMAISIASVVQIGDKTLWQDDLGFKLVLTTRSNVHTNIRLLLKDLHHLNVRSLLMDLYWGIK